MKTQHTPGPWLATQDSDSRSDGYVRVERNGMFPAVARACHSGIGVTEMRSNARLIAAAPELLEALNESLPVLKDVVRGIQDEWPATYQDSEPYRALEAVLLALAKATGKAA